MLSHWDAATHWGLLPTRGSRIHVTRPSASNRDPDRRRIHLHRVGTLRIWETTFNDRIPTTTVARTLLDLSPHIRARAMEDLIAQAERLRLFDLTAVRKSLDEHPRQRGAPALRGVLDVLAGQDPSDVRSVLELLLAQLCDDHDLPRPALNANADSYTYHSMPSAFEADRESLTTRRHGRPRAPDACVAPRSPPAAPCPPRGRR